jgi:hypothetical protein
LTPFAEAWTAHVGTFEFGPAARALKPVVGAVGQAEAVRLFEAYIAAAEGGKLSLAHFGRTYVTVGKPRRGRSTSHDNQEAIREFLAEGEEDKR